MSAAESSWIFAVGEKDFKTRVLDASQDVPVVVDFWAPWCSPCRMLAPLLERLVNERQGEVLLAKVNIDEEQGLALEFGIESIPAVIAFRGGRAVVDFVGVLPEMDLRKFLDSIGPTEADRNLRQAGELEKTDPAQAEQAYRAALAKDHTLESARLGLARLLYARNKDDEAAEHLENIGSGSVHAREAEQLSARIWFRKHTQGFGDEKTLQARLVTDPKNNQARYELGCVLALAGRYQEALDLLLAAGERDPGLASTKVREAMVQVFHLVGDQSPLANDYRNRLSLLLY